MRDLLVFPLKTSAWQQSPSAADSTTSHLFCFLLHSLASSVTPCLPIDQRKISSAFRWSSTEKAARWAFCVLCHSHANPIHNSAEPARGALNAPKFCNSIRRAGRCAVNSPLIKLKMVQWLMELMKTCVAGSKAHSAVCLLFSALSTGLSRFFVGHCHGN